MPQCWLVPVDEPSYPRTIAQKVDLTAAPYKPGAFPDEAPLRSVRTDPEWDDWKRKRRNFERMAPGDPLLVYLIWPPPRDGTASR